jgi:hypothetical protein
VDPDRHGFGPVGGGVGVLHHGQKLDDIPELVSGGDVGLRDGRDALAVDVAGHDARPEGHVGEDGRLGRGIEPLDIRGRVPLGVPQTLCLGKGVVVAGSELAHPRQDEVGRAVDDAHDPPDALAGQ